MPDAKTSRRAPSGKVRRECFERHRWTDKLTGRVMLTCHICHLPLDPARDLWDADHVIRRVLKPSDSSDDVMPAHRRGCHSEKTKTDISENSKGKRVHDRHYGIKTRSGFRKPPEGYKYSWAQHRYVRVEEE